MQGVGTVRVGYPKAGFLEIISKKLALWTVPTPYGVLAMGSEDPP